MDNKKAVDFMLVLLWKRHTKRLKLRIVHGLSSLSVHEGKYTTEKCSFLVAGVCACSFSRCFCFLIVISLSPCYAESREEVSVCKFIQSKKRHARQRSALKRSDER